MNSKERRAEELKREEILLEIPRFVNYLLLLLAGGMVLQEAMISISRDYQSIPKQNRTLFQKKFLDNVESAKNNGDSIIQAFESFAKKEHVKELSRLSQIISDSNNKGIDISDILIKESKLLWDERKRIVLQKMRVAESKMSFPLALILMALILITAAPAMMQMYID